MADSSVTDDDERRDCDDQIWAWLDEAATAVAAERAGLDVTAIMSGALSDARAVVTGLGLDMPVGLIAVFLLKGVREGVALGRSLEDVDRRTISEMGGCGERRPHTATRGRRA